MLAASNLFDLVMDLEFEGDLRAFYLSNRNLDLNVHSNEGRTHVVDLDRAPTEFSSSSS